jgi:hypothetical protein
VYSGLPIRKAVILVSSPPGVTTNRRWFVVQQEGTVVSFDPQIPNTTELEQFLDISDRVLADTGETGLLGMAFHPLYPAENKAYLFYRGHAG